MTSSKSSKSKEGAFWKKRFPSFFLLFLSLSLVAGCKSLEPPKPEFDWQKVRGERQMERIRKEKNLTFAVLKDSPGEERATRLAEKAAGLLGMTLAVLRVAPENIPSLLRSNRADFAFGYFHSPEEVKSLYLLPLSIECKEEILIFALPGNGQSWAEMLRKVLMESVAQEGKNAQE